jgi:hypothetical protein
MGDGQKAEQRLSKLKKVGIGAGVLVMVFLLGYVPSCVDARSVREENARLSQKLKLAELRGQLGMMSYEANRNNYANSAQLSTDFFNGLREAVSSINDEAMKKKLEALLTRRDEITVNLAEPNPAVKDKLAQMYAEFYQATALKQ